MKLIICILFFATLPIYIWAGKKTDFSKGTYEVASFVRNTIYSPQEGDRSSYSSRWVVKPKLDIQVFDSAKERYGELVPYIEEHFSELCEIARLPETPKDDFSEEAEFDVYFGTYKELREIARKIKRKVFKNGSSAWNLWDQKRRLTHTVLFIPIDNVSSLQDLKYNTLQLMISNFGIYSRSDEFEESVLFEEYQVRTELTELDKKLIRFYYEHIPPYTHARRIRYIVKEKW